MIVTFDGKPVANAHELPKIVATSPVGKQVEVVVIRDGKEHDQKGDARPARGQCEGQAAKAAEVAEKPALPLPVKPMRMGLDLPPLDDGARVKFQIKDSVKSGVVIGKVDPASPAAEQHLAPGDVIVEVNRQPVTAPEEIMAKTKTLKDEGRKTALLLLANPQGQARFIALTLE